MKRILFILILIISLCLVPACAESPPSTSFPPDTEEPSQTEPESTEPESTPSPGYSRSNPVGVNSPLSIEVRRAGVASNFDNDYEVRITLIDFLRGEEAWQLIEEANMFNDPPESGFEYILAKVRFEYLVGPTPDTAYDVSPVWFDAVSSAGKDYDMVSVVEPDPSIRANLYPGASHEGWVSFHIAQDDTGPLMTFGRKYDGTGGIWFKLY